MYSNKNLYGGSNLQQQPVQQQIEVKKQEKIGPSMISMVSIGILLLFHFGTSNFNGSVESFRNLFGFIEFILFWMKIGWMTGLGGKN